MKLRVFALALTLAACGNQPAGNVTTNSAVSDGPMPAGAPPLPKVPPLTNCVLPKLDFRAAANLGSKEQSRFSENFRVAFYKACGEKLFADGPLIDAESANKSTLFVLNAPEANVTSIYFSPSAAPPNTLIESPLGTPPQIPSVDDLHEAIYCAVRGATPEEEERDGRCLPD